MVVTAMTDMIAVEIGALAGLDLSALRGRWHKLNGTSAPTRMSRELLIQAIAYRLQEQVHGGLAPAVLVKLKKPVDTGARPRVRVERRVKPGTRFLREWQGRTHEAVATEDGQFLYRGIAYRSLSAIAREITGIHWSGPRFFGLTSRSRHDGR
jgi:hypothetical protein